jgi:hypothetical protein
VNGCVGMGPSALLCPVAYDVVNTVLLPGHSDNR